MVIVSGKYKLPIGSKARLTTGSLVYIRSMPYTSKFGLGTVVDVEYSDPKERDDHGVWPFWPSECELISA